MVSGYGGYYNNGQGTVGYGSGQQRGQYIYCYIDNGNIVQVDTSSTGQSNKVVGVVSQVYDSLSNELNDLRDTCMGYYNKLVELGAITVPKTPEEISETQSKVLEEILDGFKMLNSRLEKLENKEALDNEHTENI